MTNAWVVTAFIAAFLSKNVQQENNCLELQQPSQKFVNVFFDIMRDTEEGLTKYLRDLRRTNPYKYRV